MFPLATVETISLGRPIGKALRAGEMSAVPPLPPMPMTPATRPAFDSASRYRSSAWLIAVTAWPRSFLVGRAARGIASG